MKILQVSKCWRQDVDKILEYHPSVDLVIGNNLGFEFVDMGETDDPYYLPELRGVQEAAKRGAEYILWYASDVTPPEGDWVTPALKLLKKYPIVSPFWMDNYKAVLDTFIREERGGVKETEFGFEDHMFSDQAYIAKVSTMQNIDYNADSYVKNFYPPHGGNSFECRVAQWLESTNQRRAVLRDFQYRHTLAREK